MEAADFWNDSSLLDNFLAKQLMQQRLAIVLGAGISKSVGLPEWSELVDRMYNAKSVSRNPKLSPERASELFFQQHCNNDDQTLVECVRLALYERADLSPSFLSNERLLNALGAIMTSSSRGRAACAVTFNYDDLLETHLRIRGFVVESVFDLPSWNPLADMTVFHAHGFLPSDSEEKPSRGIVLTSADYDRVIGNAEDLWNQKLLDVMRSHTCLFIGLSGDDQRLGSLLQKVRDSHSSRAYRHPFWGVRPVASADDVSIQYWAARGVYCRNLANYANIPDWLLNICRIAARKRQRKSKPIGKGT